MRFPKTAIVVLLSIGLGAPALAEIPFITEEAETMQPGRFSLDFGLGLRDDPRDFAVPDRDWQVNIATTRLSFGVGRLAELQVTGVPLVLLRQDGEQETNVGDWIIGTKVWIISERGKRPAISFLYEVKLPNADNEIGGGTDETDFFGNHHHLVRPQT